MGLHDFRVGFFLTRRYIRGSNPWAIGLITFVMVLTFLNLTVISGILEGIIVGSFDGFRNHLIGDVYVSPKPGDTFIGRSQYILSALQGDVRVAAVAPRIVAPVEIIEEQEFFNVINTKDHRKIVATQVVGVVPDVERAVTSLNRHVSEGSYFSDFGGQREILIGSNLLERHSPFGDDVLGSVYPGDFVRVGIKGLNSDPSPNIQSNRRGSVVSDNTGSDTQVSEVRGTRCFSDKNRS